MKKLSILALTMLCATAVTTHAGDAAKKESKGKGPKKELTAEQKAVNDEILAKYDANKDGKLDAAEKAKISAEDKAKMEKAGLSHGKKKAADAAKTEAPKADAAK
ncbi:MAG: hypothetical protein RLZZ350_184 [Verrucomicrobiota bacterium]|jgi:hypothetical protein